MSPSFHVDAGLVQSCVLAGQIIPLAPVGMVAIAMWDALWAQAAEAVDPEYVNSPILPPRHETGRAQLEAGLKRPEFSDVHAEARDIGFDVGKEGFIAVLLGEWNPLAVDRQSFKSDLGNVRTEMERLLDDFDDGENKIPLSATLAPGRKPEWDCKMSH